MDIYQLTSLDAPWLAAMHAEAFESPWSEQSFADLLNSPAVLGWYGNLEKGPGFILTQAAGDQGEILTFQVAKASRGQGLGKALFRQAVGALRDCDIKHIYLEVRADRLTAKKIYENQGFKLEGCRKNYYRRQESPQNTRMDAEIWALHF